MEYSDYDQVVEVLGGAVRSRVIYHPDRAFAFEVTLDLEKGADFCSHKPPLHFHVNQDEYIEAIEGETEVEVNGREIVLRPGDPELCIKAWENHRPYNFSVSRRNSTSKVKFLLSGTKTAEPFQLNLLFFENWYRYQDNVVKSQKSFDIIQVLSTLDAGGTYLSPPSWIPCGKRLSQMIGVLVGRWVGSFFGYQPFYREWSTDWDLACKNMKTCFAQARFATHSKRT
ncbi:hypothetical protein GGS21DRAFT_544513 [Xylaria nigripes]|nr:hypothetical protein GGS21DRAFT_544513 [Xylaria nigripes]